MGEVEYSPCSCGLCSGQAQESWNPELHRCRQKETLGDVPWEGWQRESQVLRALLVPPWAQPPHPLSEPRSLASWGAQGMLS